MMDGFDYIIVGAGSSGCVLANRLSENPRNRVLLIEAGGRNRSPFISMAGGFTRIMGKPDYFRFFPVAQQEGRRQEMQMYGRGLGGSSAINGTWYLTGAPGDYDGWRDLGLDGWGWDDISRCFNWMEDYRDPGGHPGRGRSGPMQVTPSDYSSPLLDALAETGKIIGAQWLDDITTPGVSGVGRTQYTVDRKGRRVTSYTAFVEPVKNRPNLTIVTDCTVKRIAVSDRKATGIVCDRDGVEVSFAAAGEVILSSGVYGSPQLLQLSGIGDGAELSALGIAVQADLQAVGRNLSDHQKLGITFDLHNHPGTNREFVGWRVYRNALRYFLFGDGPLARVGMPLTMLYSSKGRAERPDYQLSFAPFAMRTVKEMSESPGSPITAKPGLTFGASHLHPKSRGRVTITSPNHAEAPLVHSEMWSDPFDQERALWIFKILRQLAAGPSMKPYIGAERFPGAEVTDDESLIAHLRQTVDPGLHGTGTCRMGTDLKQSVVDSQCRVHGVDRLRVVDCSVMPTTVSGNTNGPAMAVGARAGEIILAGP